MRTRAARFRPSTWRKDGTVEATISTDAPVDVMDVETGKIVREVLTSDGVDLPASVRLLDSHRTDEVERVLGSMRELKAGEHDIGGRVVWARHGRAQDAARSVEDGHVTDFSIGYEVNEVADVDAGGSVEIRGRVYEAGEAPLRVATRWTLYEATLCALGADRAAKVRQKERSMGDDAMDTVRECDEDEDEDEKKRAEKYTEKVETKSEIKREDMSEDEDEDEEEEEESDDEEDEPEDDERVMAVVKAERARVRKINTIASNASRELREKAIADGWTVKKTALAVIEELATRRAPVKQTTARRTAGGPTAQALEDALAMQYGVYRREANVNDEVDGQRRAAAEPWRKMSPMGLIEMGLRSVGQYRRGMAKLDAIRTFHALEREAVRATTMQQRENPMVLTLPKLFENVLNKAVMVGFFEQEDTTDWCAESYVADYKELSRMRIGSLPTPGEVPLNQPVPMGSIDEEGEKYVVKRYGEAVRLDEIHLINDDLNQFVLLASMLGAAARRIRPDLVYAIVLNNAALSDSVTLFHATSHGANLVSGAGSALGDTGLASAIALMGKQTGKQGEQLNISPSYLIVPWDLHHTARKLIESTETVNFGATEAVGTANVHKGAFQVRTEGRLSNTSFYASATATRWFIAASPRRAPTVEVAYLREQPQPRVTELPLETSVQRKWEVVFSMGAKALDYRGVVRCEGV